jgi:hypothetical protein
MPTEGFHRHRRFRAKQAAVRVCVLDAGCSPLGSAPAGHCLPEGRQFLLANQNLQDLVLKCLLRTKDSRVGDAWQALFDAQQEGPKTTLKTAHWRAVRCIFTHLPPPIHRVVHRKSHPTNGCAYVAVLRQRGEQLGDPPASARTTPYSSECAGCTLGFHSVSNHTPAPFARCRSSPRT